MADIVVKKIADLDIDSKLGSITLYQLTPMPSTTSRVWPFIGAAVKVTSNLTSPYILEFIKYTFNIHACVRFNSSYGYMFLGNPFIQVL